ncbi:MAG: hypothetical protein AVDCRST_MAG56-2705 [uncultured Cytophagales bacterium]|uniref:Uncharacterized protein n=1 Tax=uncultured Cytophagales bacterium TaxID=158755 RepID=A0A6J4ITA2_9SPHI|nr:MAG: hypothetical protein AVDCRST_MAG56-2705 [uncultured Cytophagales bacterium]
MLQYPFWLLCGVILCKWVCTIAGSTAGGLPGEKVISQ